MKLPKIYEPAQYEDTVYALWEKSGAFAPTTSGKENYSIVMPPPNANGNLHLGHALTIAVQDTLIRYHRMRGYNTLYLPGADHADGHGVGGIYRIWRWPASQGRRR